MRNGIHTDSPREDLNGIPIWIGQNKVFFLENLQCKWKVNSIFFRLWDSSYNLCVHLAIQLKANVPASNPYGSGLLMLIKSIEEVVYIDCRRADIDIITIH